MSARVESFRARLAAGEPLLGTFMKTPSSIVAEVLTRSPLDVVCIDAEHAPFGRLEQDQCVAALRAGDMPSLVRVPGDAPNDIRNALDSGATGILVPHVCSAAQAAAVVRAAHFGDGGRGYAGSTRAAEFTHKGMAEHLADSAAATAVVVQIEDIEALDRAGEIAAVDGVDAVFVGRADLAAAMGLSIGDEAVVNAVRDVCSQARGVPAAVGMFTPDLAELGDWLDCGASLFLLSSDQSFVVAGAGELQRRFAAALSRGSIR